MKKLKIHLIGAAIALMILIIGAAIRIIKSVSTNESKQSPEIEGITAEANGKQLECDNYFEIRENEDGQCVIYCGVKNVQWSDDGIIHKTNIYIAWRYYYQNVRDTVIHAFLDHLTDDKTINYNTFDKCTIFPNTEAADSVINRYLEHKKREREAEIYYNEVLRGIRITDSLRKAADSIIRSKPFSKRSIICDTLIEKK